MSGEEEKLAMVAGAVDAVDIGTRRRGQFVNFAWGCGNEIALVYTPTSVEAARQGQDAVPSGDDGTVAVYAWDQHVTEMDMLIKESHGVFMALQRLAEETAEGDGRALTGDDVLATSQHYRAIMHSQMLALQQAADVAPEDLREEYIEQEALLVSWELIWHLCEVLYVDPASSLTNMVGPRLVAWLQLHTPVPSLKEVYETPQPDTHPDFWACVRALVLQGRTEMARNLLGQHSGTSNMFLVEWINAVSSTLEQMPTPEPHGDYLPAWHSWHKLAVDTLASCRAQRAHVDAQACGEALDALLSVLAILAGDVPTLVEHCERWYELLVARALYCDPGMPMSDLESAVAACVRDTGGPSTLTNLDEILSVLMSQDLHRALRYCDTLLGSYWYMAHLVDMLWHCGHIERYQLDLGCDLREYYILEYANKLVLHGTHWQVAAGYLSYAPVFGAAYLELYLERQHPATERTARKLAHTARSHGLDETSRVVARVVGRRWLALGRPIAALEWFLAAGAVGRVSRVADAMLAGMLAGEPTGDVRAVARTAMAASTRLTFLAKYTELVELVHKGKEQAAARLITRLVSPAGIAPPAYVPVLLHVALPMLEGPRIVFDADATRVLMGALEAYAVRGDDTLADGDAAPSAPPTLPAKAPGTGDAAALTVLRLALSRNLARAVLDAGVMSGGDGGNAGVSEDVVSVAHGVGAMSVVDVDVSAAVVV